MATELLILSGAQSGKRLTFDQEIVLIGRDRDCDLRFKDPGTHGRRAWLVANDDGWHLCNDGQGLWFVNQTVVSEASAHPVRSGDILRLSEFGPDVCFAILAEEKVLPAGEDA